MAAPCTVERQGEIVTEEDAKHMARDLLSQAAMVRAAQNTAPSPVDREEDLGAFLRKRVLKRRLDEDAKDEDVVVQKCKELKKAIDAHEDLYLKAADRKETSVFLNGVTDTPALRDGGGLIHKAVDRLKGYRGLEYRVGWYNPKKNDADVEYDYDKTYEFVEVHWPERASSV